jgi:hypothetical protein
MSANDWIGVGIVVLVIVGGLLLLNQITKPYDVKTEDEFEKRRKEQAGMMRTGIMGLQQFLDPGAKKGVEVQQDLNRGLYDDEEEPDDPPEAGGTHASGVPRKDKQHARGVRTDGETNA